MGEYETTELRRGGGGHSYGGGRSYSRPSYSRTTTVYRPGSYGHHTYIGIGGGYYSYGSYHYYSNSYGRVHYIHSQPLGVVGSIFVFLVVAIFIVVIVVAAYMSNGQEEYGDEYVEVRETHFTPF